ncbi:MAG: 2-oxo acid dehydrogenase subunit E2 [Actinobacteria bacterium]|nr:2-oxo acid dehydrogenase subunit E2 [Actinomycetota bacterium]
MAENVVMPKLGLTMTEGTIVKWMKKEGERIEKGEPLLEVASDKIDIEVESPHSGILGRILVPEGQTVPVTTPIAVIVQPGEELVGVEKTQTTAQLSRVPEKLTPAARRVARENGVDLAELVGIRGTGGGGRVTDEDVRRFIAQKQDEARIKATPVAEKMAREHGLDLREVAGAGNRVTKGDVIAALESRNAAPPTTRSIPLVGMRKIIAERMSLSRRNAADVTLMARVDMTEASKLREQLLAYVEKSHGTRVSYTEIIVRATALALKAHPIVNSTLVDSSPVGGEIRLLEDINIGVAVALDRGLIVPVVRQADRKSIPQISLEVKKLVEKAQSGTLDPDDVTGGTFTITNLGTYGIDSFTPIINYPEAAILGVGRISEEPAVVEGSIVKRQIMQLSLSFDHRVLDGAPAAEFLSSVREMLERPYTLLLEG